MQEGLVSIAYRDATPGSPRVRFASGPGADWTLETVDATGDPGIGSQLELNNFGEPRIAYFDQATQRVLFAAKAGATWAVGEVDVQATSAIGLARTEADSRS